MNQRNIIVGLPEHTNDPATFAGKPGYWVQGDCVFVEADYPEQAIDVYRRWLADAEVAISHNLGCSEIRRIRMMTRGRD